jgi:LemA protein
MNRREQTGSMKIGCAIAAGVAVALLVVIGLTVMGKYNSLVTLQEKVEAAWSEIDNQYKRRYDLIPQLVNTVQGAADFEKSTLEAVTEARASVGRAQLPPGLPADEAQLRAYIEAQQGLGAALGRLFVVVERYPELKANQNFLSLQDQLEGTENRIAVARRDYIDAVRLYNTGLRRFPGNLVAGLFGFDPRPQLQIDEAERETPQVDFDFKDNGGDGAGQDDPDN